MASWQRIAERSEAEVKRLTEQKTALVTALANAINSLEYLKPETFDDEEHAATWHKSMANYYKTLNDATQ